MAKGEKIRIILDTNWYVSAILNKKSRRTLYEFLINKRLEILYTDQLQSEFLDVINRPKFKNIITSSQIQRFFSLILPRLDYIPLKTSTALSRDPKDNYLLSLALDGKADYLVTGDLDLLVIQEYEGIRIMKMMEFRQLLAEI